MGMVLAGAAVAAPTPTNEGPADRAQIAKRASVTDSAIGYASQNGGTTGGAGGTTTTVSSYAEFTAAVTSDDAKVVFVSGTYTEAAKQVKVGNNTSIIGVDSSAGLVGNGM